MILRTLAFGIFVGLTSLTSTWAQDTKNEEEAMARANSSIYFLMRVAREPKLAEQLELLPSQQSDLQIAVQKYSDGLVDRLRKGAKTKLAQREHRKSSIALMSKIDKILVPKQVGKLAEMVKSAKEATGQPTDKAVAAEVRKVIGALNNLQQLVYSRDLAESLEVTAEQKVELRESLQDLSLVSQELTSRRDTPLTLKGIKDIVGNRVIDAESILTAEQLEKLMRSQKLGKLKQKHGDEFGMVIGLADDFGMEPEDVAKLRERIKVAREDYYQKMLKVREEMVDRIVSEVPRDHRDEVREAIQSFPMKDARKTSPLPSFGN